MNEELLEIIKKFNGFHPDMLYDEIITLNKPRNFNDKEFVKFLVTYTLIMGKSITNPQQIREYWRKAETMERIKVEKINNSLNGISPHWIGMNIPHNTGDSEKGEQVESIKIYLSIDNSSLHRFANLFIISCLEYGYADFDFKINKDESTNRRDNVVIYCNDKNFGQYVKLIQEIIQNNRDIIFNDPHLLGIPCDEHIYCGIDFDNGNISYTDQMCKTIFDALNNGIKPEDIIRIIETFKQKHQVSLIALTDMTSNNIKR